MNFWPFAKKNADENYYSVEGETPAEKAPVATKATKTGAPNPLKNFFSGGKLPPGNGTGKLSLIQGGPAKPVEDIVEETPEETYAQQNVAPEQAAAYQPEVNQPEAPQAETTQEDDYKPKAYRPQPTANNNGEYNPGSMAENAIPHVPQPKPRKREEAPLSEDVNNMFPEQAVVDDPADPLSNPVALDNLIKSVDDMLHTPEAVNPQDVFTPEENVAETRETEYEQPENYQPETSPEDLNTFMADNSLEFVSTAKPVENETEEDYPGAPGYVVPEAVVPQAAVETPPENYQPEYQPDATPDPYAGFETPAVTDFGDFVPAAEVDVPPVENTVAEEYAPEAVVPAETPVINETDAAFAPPPTGVTTPEYGQQDYQNNEPADESFGDFDGDSLLAELKASKPAETPDAAPVAQVPVEAPIEAVAGTATDADLAPPVTAEVETPAPVIPLDYVAETPVAESPVDEPENYQPENYQPVQLNILPNIPQAVDITPPYTGETQPPVEYNAPAYEHYAAEGFDESPEYDGEDYGDVHVEPAAQPDVQPAPQPYDYELSYETETYNESETEYEEASYETESYEDDEDEENYESYEEESCEAEPYDNPYSDYNVIEGQPKYDLTSVDQLPQAGTPAGTPPAAPRKKPAAVNKVQDFEARVILEESRFVKNSIDSLVDRYFNSSENDKKHYG